MVCGGSGVTNHQGLQLGLRYCDFPLDVWIRVSYDSFRDFRCTVRKDISTKKKLFFFIYLTISTRKMHIPGLRMFSPYLHFSRCHLGMLHFDPYQSSEVPFFWWAIKIMYLKFTSNRAPRPPKWSPSEDWHGFKWNIPRWQSPKQRHGEKLVIMFEYRVFKLWKKVTSFWRNISPGPCDLYGSSGKARRWDKFIVILFFTRSSELASETVLPGAVWTPWRSSGSGGKLCSVGWDYIVESTWYSFSWSPYQGVSGSHCP